MDGVVVSVMRQCLDAQRSATPLFEKCVAAAAIQEFLERYCCTCGAILKSAAVH